MIGLAIALFLIGLLLAIFGFSGLLVESEHIDNYWKEFVHTATMYPDERFGIKRSLKMVYAAYNGYWLAVVVTTVGTTAIAISIAMVVTGVP